MKRLFLIALVTFFNVIVCLSQANGTEDGNIGVQTKIGPNGQYLKITCCKIGYPAYISGLKVNDRIYQINGKNVSELTDPISYLQGGLDTNVKLKISRFSQIDTFNVHVQRISNGSSTVKKDPNIINSYISEEELTAGYIDRWKIAVTSCLSDDAKDLFKYKTYDFEFSSITDPLIEKKIFEELGNQLNEMGMKRSYENPELLIIITFYSGKKEQYVPPQQMISTKIKNVYNWYWGVIPLAVTESVTKNGYTVVTYLANISLKFLDANEIKGSKIPPVVWSGSISQSSTKEAFLTDKSKEFIRVMLDQFPEVWQENSKAYDIIRYKYTGIVYDKNDIHIIGGVVSGSPAFNIGIRKGDKILSIDGRTLPSKFNYKDYAKNFAFGKAGSNYKESGLNYIILPANKNSVFKVERNGENLTYEFNPEIRFVVFYNNNRGTIYKSNIIR